MLRRGHDHRLKSDHVHLRPCPQCMISMTSTHYVRKLLSLIIYGQPILAQREVHTLSMVMDIHDCAFWSALALTLTYPNHYFLLDQ